MISRVFEPCDRAWRGIGVIPESGYRLREEFAGYDAARIFDLEGIVSRGAGELHQRDDFAGRATAARVPGVRDGMHARNAAGGDDGIGGGRLRGLLQLWEASGAVKTAADSGQAEACPTDQFGRQAIRGQATKFRHNPAEGFVASPRIGTRMNGPNCPLPMTDRKTVVLGHGSGGKLTAQLDPRDLPAGVR